MSSAFKGTVSKIDEASVFAEKGEKLLTRKALRQAFSYAVKMKRFIGKGQWKIENVVSEIGLLSMNDEVKKGDLSPVKRDLTRLMLKKLC